MNILLDTSVLVEVDRKKEHALELMEKLRERHSLSISVVTISEIMTGAKLSSKKNSVEMAKDLLMRFDWVKIDSEIAEIAGVFTAERFRKGKIAEYQDDLIIATFQGSKADFLIAENKKHFEDFIPEEKLLNIKEALNLIPSISS